MTKAERQKKLEERLAEMKEFERPFYEAGAKYIAGVDEVGRGPLAGPVVTACVVLPRDFSILGVDDSKKLSEKKREQLFDEILENAIAYGIGIEDNRVIDEINILQATKRAMTKAVEEADEKLGGKIDHVLFDAIKIDAVAKPQTSVIKGDAKSISIAAASIVAKVTRDRMMIEYAKEYPYYAFESNKGYGTKAHYEGIEEHGITPIHRLTFLKNLNLK